MLKILLKNQKFKINSKKKPEKKNNYKMITVKIVGGLGNQLFQIFTVISYSLDNKVPFKFLYGETTPSVTKRYTYWNSFLSSLQFFVVKDVMGRDFYEGFKKEPTKERFHYVPLRPFDSIGHENIILNGYFQSYKYFHHHRNEIFRLIQLKEQKDKFLQKHNIISTENTISLHFRLGDYKRLSHTHPIMNPEYYVDALTYILSKSTIQKYRVIYFCEAEDNETVRSNYIEKISNVFPFLTFKKAGDNMRDYEQVLYQSCCTHNIIANSTFSWFGAYFNENKGQHVVCYPSRWYGGEAKNNKTTDMFLPDWIKIQCN